MGVAAQFWSGTARTTAAAKSEWTPGHRRRSNDGWPIAWSSRSAASCAIVRSDPRTGVVSQRGTGRAAPPRAQGRSQAPLRAPPAAPRPRRRAAARGDPAAANPASARPLAPIHDRHLPGGNQHRGDHLHRPRQAGANDARQRRPRPLAGTRGAHPALPHPGPCSQAKQQPHLSDAASRVGWPGESHPRAPTDPGVTVSRHRALLISTDTSGPGASGRTVRAVSRAVRSTTC